MALMQLDFFEDVDFIEIKGRMESVERSCDRVRKKQFAEIGTLKKQLAEVIERMEIIERGICKHG
jgi:hypothetical protein